MASASDTTALNKVILLCNDIVANERATIEAEQRAKEEEKQRLAAKEQRKAEEVRVAKNNTLPNTSAPTAPDQSTPIAQPQTTAAEVPSTEPEHAMPEMPAQKESTGRFMAYFGVVLLGFIIFGFAKWRFIRRGNSTTGTGDKAENKEVQIEEITLLCPQCEQSLACDTNMSGMTVTCPACSQNFVIPPVEPVTPVAAMAVSPEADSRGGFHFLHLWPIAVCILGLGWGFYIGFPYRVFLQLSSAVWAVIIFAMISVPLAVVSFSYFIRRGIPVKSCILALGFTAFVGIVWLLKFQDYVLHWREISVPTGWLARWVQVLIFIGKEYEIAFSHSGSSLMEQFLAYITSVGLCEETTKLLPLFLILLVGGGQSLYKRKSYTDFLWIGFFSGLGFGISEGLSTKYAPWGECNQVAAIITRWFACVPSHAVWTVIDAALLWYLAQHIERSRRPDLILCLCLLATVAAAVLHGIYDVLCGIPFMGPALVFASIILLYYIVSYVWRATKDQAPTHPASRGYLSTLVAYFQQSAKPQYLALVASFLVIIVTGVACSVSRQDAIRLASSQGGPASPSTAGTDTGGDDSEDITKLLKSANQGNANAQCNLGLRYDNANGIDEDHVEAVKWFRKAALQGHARAQSSLGASYASGRGGIQEDQVEAVKWFRKAADQGFARAQCQLGTWLYLGKGVTQNSIEAVIWLQKAAAQGDANAHNLLTYIKQEKTLAPLATEDRETDIEGLRKAAAQGDVKAQNNLSVCYFNGRGVAQDLVKAVEWFRKAAAQGCALAQDNLGVCYYNGKGITQDRVEAVKWFRKAAVQGDANAQKDLATCYDDGEGVTQDLAAAVEWYRKAAAQSNPVAQNSLGVCYANGRGVAKDLVKAATWYREAAVQGDANAQYNLGCCYHTGEGIAQDQVEAVKWFRKAAAQGEANAQLNLGVSYYYGNGVHQDFVAAVNWLSKAAAQGHEGAKKLLQRIDQEVKERR